MLSLFDLGSVIKTLKDAGDDDDGKNIDKISKMLQKNKSIVGKAKDAVMLYPAIFSNNVGDMETALAISKYLEIQYSIFTLIALGLDPFMSGNNMRAKLSEVSGESLFEDTKHELYADISIEAKKKDKKNERDSHNSRSRDKNLNTENNAKYNVELMKKLQNSEPTIVNVELVSEKHEKKFPITLAIKVSPHIVSDEEATLIVKYIHEDKSKLTRFLRATSGEIGFFKDFLLQMDRAKDDTVLYESMGRHPWFRELQKRKTKSMLSNLLQFVPFVKKYINKAPVLPTTSLVLKAGSMEDAFKRDMRVLIRESERWINGMLKEGMLLCMATYDDSTETLYFFFNGMRKPIVTTLEEIKRSSKNDPTKEMAKAIQSISKLV